MKFSRLLIAAAVCPALINIHCSKDAKVSGLNRALTARTLASSSRLFEPGDAGVPASKLSVLILNPATVPLLKADYAVDGVASTTWASDATDYQWLRLEFSNAVKDTVEISAVVVRWGNSYALDYSIDASNDNLSWSNIYYTSNGKGGTEIIKFKSPASLRFLRLITRKSSTGAGVSVAELEAYTSALEEPGVPRSVQVRNNPYGGIILTWNADVLANPYIFRIHRLQSPSDKVSEDNLAGSAERFRFMDYAIKNGSTAFYSVVAESFNGGRSLPSDPVSATADSGLSGSDFEIRGLVEGAYNDPYPHRERMKLVEFLEGANFNYYMYAPAYDLKARALWREPYAADEMMNFKRLSDRCRSRGIEFTYSIRPGEDYNFDAPDSGGDFGILMNKCRGLYDIGVRSFALLLDDIPETGQADDAMGKRHAALANAYIDALKAWDPEIKVYFCPAIYWQKWSYWKDSKPAYADYIDALRTVKDEILIYWTGPGNVFSPVITVADAVEQIAHVGNRVLLWDNYPVNDGFNKNKLVMGPYTGKDPALGKYLRGIVANGMIYPNPNVVPLYTIGAFMSNSAAYSPEAAFDVALRRAAPLDRGYAGLKMLADNCRCHPNYPDCVESPDLKKRIADFWKAYKLGNFEAEYNSLGALFRDFNNVPNDFNNNIEDRGLLEELNQPARKMSSLGFAGLAALISVKTKSAAQAKAARNFLSEATLIPFIVADDPITEFVNDAAAEAAK
jgi:hypothetical protein